MTEPATPDILALLQAQPHISENFRSALQPRADQLAAGEAMNCEHQWIYKEACDGTLFRKCMRCGYDEEV